MPDAIRVWSLQCFECAGIFEIELAVDELISRRVREAVCPHCGHKPILTAPSNIWSAVKVHRIVGMRYEDQT